MNKRIQTSQGWVFARKLLHKGKSIALKCGLGCTSIVLIIFFLTSFQSGIMVAPGGCEAPDGICTTAVES